MITELENVISEEEACSDQLIPLLRKQAQLFGRLEGFARRQRLLVAADDTRPLLAVLAERQKLSAELARVSQRLAPVRSSWSSIRSELSLNERSEADELIEHAQRSLQNVLQSDEEDARSLMLRKQAVRQNLRASQAKGTAASAYRTAAKFSGQRLDQEL